MSDYSDSESEYQERSTTPPPAPAALASSSKKRKSEKAPTKSEKKKPTAAVSAPAKKPKLVLNKADPFNLINEEKAAIAEVRSSKRAAQLDSTFTQRVGSGVLRRTLATEGEFYVELRLYNTSEIVAIAPSERWKKSITSFKTQIEFGSGMWQHLHKLITTVDKQFVDVEPMFYSDKVQFK